MSLWIFYFTSSSLISFNNGREDKLFPSSSWALAGKNVLIVVTFWSNCLAFRICRSPSSYVFHYLGVETIIVCSGWAKKPFRLITGSTLLRTSSGRYLQDCINWYISFGPSVKYSFILTLNRIGMYDFNINIIISWSSGFGLSSPKYQSLSSISYCQTRRM